MPFCRKCGRRLPPYSESCPDCGTSTTGPLINIKKTSSVKSFGTVARTKVAKSVVPVKDIIISIKVIDHTKSAKAVTPTKSAIANSYTPVIPSKPAAPAEIQPAHEIKKSNISLKEDFITNPHDYETQTFSFNLQCPNDHFWRAYKSLPLSNGRAFCPKCGELLRKPKQKKRKPAGFNY